jgi:hypothetical protein
MLSYFKYIHSFKKRRPFINNSLVSTFCNFEHNIIQSTRLRAASEEYVPAKYLINLYFKIYLNISHVMSLSHICEAAHTTAPFHEQCMQAEMCQCHSQIFIYGLVPFLHVLQMYSDFNIFCWQRSE